jgi:hypothetical protein
MQYNILKQFNFSIVMTQLSPKIQFIYNGNSIPTDGINDIHLKVKDLGTRLKTVSETIKRHHGILSSDIEEIVPTSVIDTDQLIVQGISVKFLESAANNVALILEEAPQPLPESEAKLNPIKVCLKDLIVN